MQPVLVWAVRRDAKTGQLLRQYIASGDPKIGQPKTVHLKTSRRS
jgi:hypothetical protein